MTSVVAAPVPLTRPTVASRFRRYWRIRQYWRDFAVLAADWLHAPGDLDAARHGLTVRREGLTGRVYRDPRFDGRSTR